MPKIHVHRRKKFKKENYKCTFYHKVAAMSNFGCSDLTRAIIALDIGDGSGPEVFVQIHKPQNALLHQKMQERLIGGVVPLISELIREGNEEGIFDSQFPDEAAEMIIIYSNIAFDSLAGITGEQLMQKSKAFICHTERILGAAEGSLAPAIMNIINR